MVVFKTHFKMNVMSLISNFLESNSQDETSMDVVTIMTLFITFTAASDVILLGNSGWLVGKRPAAVRPIRGHLRLFAAIGSGFGLGF